MPDLTKEKIGKVVKKYVAKFTPKYRAFNILQNNIEDVVKKSTQIWKLIYGLTTIKQGEADPLEVNDDKKDDDKEDDDKDNIVGEEKKMKDDDKATIEQQQDEQSVQDTQVPSVSPLHDTTKTTKTLTIKDVPDALAQNINPLTEEYLKKILDHSILQDKLCGNLVLVNVDELQKAVTIVTREKVKPKEPPSIIPLVTNV